MTSAPFRGTDRRGPKEFLLTQAKGDALSNGISGVGVTGLWTARPSSWRAHSCTRSPEPLLQFKKASAQACYFN